MERVVWIVVVTITVVGKGLLVVTAQAASSYPEEASSLIVTFMEKIFPNCELLLTSATTYFHQKPYETGKETWTWVEEVEYVTQELGHASSAGMQVVSTKMNGSAFRRFDDIHKLGKDGSCGVNVVFIEKMKEGLGDTLFALLTPKYGPITRKDEDYFFFVTGNTQTAEEALIAKEFGNKIRFKLALSRQPHPEPQAPRQLALLTSDIYGNNGEPEILFVKSPSDIFVSGNVSRELWLRAAFPDFTGNLHGRPLRMSVAKVPFRFEIERDSSGIYRPKRGFHKLWLEEAMKRFNFTYDIFVSSLDGGTGKQFKNGTWGGSVGDLFYEKADISYQIAHIYNRHKFIEWSAPLTYEGIVFVTHKPRTYFSPNAIFWPFTPEIWACFFVNLIISGITFKLLAKAYARLQRLEGSDDSTTTFTWSNTRIVEYIIATFLEQDRGGPSSMPFHPIRIFCSFWLLFAFIIANAYRAKLTTLMAFPLLTYVPETFVELVDSDFGVGLNVVGKGDAAYTIFSLGRGKVYEGIFSKMNMYPDAVQCVMKAADEDFCCLLWDGYAEYIDAKNVTDKFGRSPMQHSTTKTSFIEEGLVYEKRAIFRHHLDLHIRNAVIMGLSKKWLEMDMNFVKQTRFKWERSVNKTSRVYSVDNGPVKLKVAHFLGSFLIWGSGILLSFSAFLYEFHNKVSKCLTSLVRSIIVWKVRLRRIRRRRHNEVVNARSHQNQL